MKRPRPAVAVLVMVACGVTAGAVDRIANETTAHAWQQREDDAWTAITAAQTAPGSDPLTGQNPRTRYQRCLAAVANYNQAAHHLHHASLNPDQECTP